MIDDTDFTDEIRFASSLNDLEHTARDRAEARQRPTVKAAKKLGIMGQVASFLGLKAEEVDSVEQFWRETAFAVQRKRDRLLVTVNDGSSLEVRPGSIAILGKKDDVAIEAALTQAKQLWGGKVAIYGSEDFKVKAWAHAQVAGVEVAGYPPPPEKHEQAYQEVLRLVQMKMQQHGIESIGPRATGMRDLAEKPDLHDILTKAERTARQLPLTDTSKLAAEGFIPQQPRASQPAVQLRP